MRELKCVRGAVNRHVALPEEVGQGTNVILVTVSNHNGFEHLQAIAYGVEGGMNHVDPGDAIGERDAAIDHQHAPRLLDAEAVHPDLTEATELNQPNRARHWHHLPVLSSGVKRVASLGLSPFDPWNPHVLPSLAF